MSAITYDAGTPGGDIVAKNIAKILEGVDGLRHAKTLCDEVGAIGASPYGDNFLAANNPVFDVAAGEGQAFSDNIGAIVTALNTALSANTNELSNRLHDLYQG
jgi:hypothetical protein